MANVQFDDLGFDADYSVSVVQQPDEPGYSFFDLDRQRQEAESGEDSIHRGHLEIEVYPPVGDPWSGEFHGRKGDFCGLFGTPAPGVLCVVVWGEGTWVTAADPFNYEQIPCDPIEQVFAIPGKPIIVFASPTKMVAYGEEGLLWSTTSFSNDQLEILDVTADNIHGRAWDAEFKKQVEFVVRVDSGDCQMSENIDR